jgi:hypothetical protein
VLKRKGNVELTRRSDWTINASRIVKNEVSKVIESDLNERAIMTADIVS